MQYLITGGGGDYNEPYSSLVSFPKDEETRNLWIDTVSNDRKTLESHKEIWICASHFDCPWIIVKGGRRPANPPSLFEGIPKSRSQQEGKQRTTTSTTLEVRKTKQEECEKQHDMITNYAIFFERYELSWFLLLYI